MNVRGSLSLKDQVAVIQVLRLAEHREGLTIFFEDSKARVIAMEWEALCQKKKRRRELTSRRHRY